MKRIFSSVAIAGLLALPVVGFVGCADEASSKTKETVTSPGGTTTTEVDKKIKSSGSNPPANSEGQKVDNK